MNGVETRLRPAQSFVVYGGTERYPLGPGVEAVSVGDLAAELAACGTPRR